MRWLAVVLMALALMACSETEKKAEDGAAESGGDGKLTSTAPLQPGAQIKVGNAVIALNAIVDPFMQPNQFLQPKPGERHVAIDVTITNDGDKAYDYNTLVDWKAQGADAFIYPASVGSYPEPFLGTGKLQAKGEQVRGFVGFTVKEDAVITAFIFKTLLSTNQGTFKLQ